MENKTGKYLKYAIGEIVLVVIGILIALQINNWNENSKERYVEQEYLVSLKEEFNHNLIELDSVVKSNTFNRDNAVELSNLMGPDSPSITEKEFADLAMNMTNWEVQYRPNQAVLDEIISSGKLTVFSNDKLKFTLSSYYGKLYKVKFQEEEHSELRRDIIALMNTQGNVKKMLIGEQWEDFGIGKSKFKLGNLHLLQSQELENQLVDFILTSRYLNTHYYSELKQEIDLVLELIDKELLK
ncbi:hypothetical protein SAMN04487989_1211 [Bizionia echini]|uniref:Uncharacterized protein n=1 Tax=Bizionia echini TaxID=649333 RepID=A0A1I5DV52_9FLAO|nr:DUF6090 family protein [Bizionia echini]SFO03144.1 hypothetical protein SAMN04487989_1211 [Bizionia echini]